MVLEAKMIKLKYNGHANISLTKDNVTILIDPFFSNNPVNKTNPNKVDCDYILVSHAHFDHIGDAIDISKRTGATIISTAEIANMVEEKGCKSHSMNIGGKYNFDFGYIKVTQAIHSAGIEGGLACGFIIDFYGTIIYFAGDTALFGDMELIGRMNDIDYALLPIGDNFTMGIEEALEATKMLKPKFVIPIHYDTWPLIATSSRDFKELVEKNCDAKVKIVNFNESIDI